MLSSMVTRLKLVFSSIEEVDCENYHEYSEHHQLVILEAINRAEFSKAVEMSSAVVSQMDKVKVKALRHKRNSIFIETSKFHVLNHLSRFWEFVLHEQYYKSWCSLQDTLDNLRNVKRFSDHDSALVDLLEVQLKAIESVYPYRLFSSTGIIFEGCNCNICGEDIDSFECCHIQGELYEGEIAIGIAQKIKELDHIAIVEHPEDKRCVVGADDYHPNMLVLRDLGQYVLQGKLKPLGFKDLLKVEFDKVNDAYVELKPNQKCFCGSGIKFKKCCRGKTTVRHKHYEFIGIGLMHN